MKNDMRYYKQAKNGYILSIGVGIGFEEISEEEYTNILSVIHGKPARSESADYRLREDLTWEEYSIDPPDPDPEINEAELLDILMGGAV